MIDRASFKSSSRARGFALAAVCSCLLAHPGLAQQPSQWSPWSPELTPTPRSEAAEIADLMRAGKKDLALQRADAFLAIHPRDLQVRFLRAVVLIDQGQTADATKELEKLTQEFPELPEPYNNLAVLAASNGGLERAERLLQQALSAQPNYVTAQENLGDLYAAMSVAAFEKASRMDPSSTTLRSKLALARDLTTKLKATR
jgi:Flp pilus assembly protein TadD